MFEVAKTLCFISLMFDYKGNRSALRTAFLGASISTLLHPLNREILVGNAYIASGQDSPSGLDQKGSGLARFFGIWKSGSLTRRFSEGEYMLYSIVYIVRTAGSKFPVGRRGRISCFNSMGLWTLQAKYTGITDRGFDGPFILWEGCRKSRGNRGV